MAEGSVVVYGFSEAQAKTQSLPETAKAALKAVATATAQRILTGYQARLLAQTKARKTAASARLLDEFDERQITVNVPGDPDDPANLPMWLEHGTRRMTAKPALRPAGDAQNARFKADVTAVYERLLRDLW